MARVLIAGFCSLPGPDRAGVQLGHVLRAVGRKNSVDVLCVRRGDQAYVERRGAARVLRVPVPDDTLVERVDTFRRALRRQLEGADYDAILVRDSYAGIPALEMRDSLDYALIFDAGRSPMAEAPLGDEALAQVVAQEEDECVREADLILAPTEAARQYLATRARPERVHTVPLGVDIDLFDWDDDPRIGPDRILCVGSFPTGRGLDILAAAMAPIAEASDVNLVIAGHIAPEVRTIFERSNAAGPLEGRIELVGEMEHRRIPELISTATLCVAPSAVELSPRPTTVFPTKILEYMACRRAVVAPRVGTVTLLMRDRQHGLLFNPGDPGSLTTQLARLLSDEDLRERLARGGYDMVRRNHSASATRRAVRRALSWLATQGPWAERWNRTDEVEDEDLVQIDSAGDAEITESLGLGEEPGAMQPPARQPISYTTEQPIYVSDDVVEPEDHTVVESAKLDTAESPLRSDTTSDDWVVPDHQSSTKSYPVDYPPQRGLGDEENPLESRFVAGELEVSSPGDPSTSETAPVEVEAEPEPEPDFTAMSPPLGLTPAPELIKNPRSPKVAPPTPRRPRPKPRPTEKSEPPAMSDEAHVPPPRATGRGTGSEETPPSGSKMGPPARVSASDAVRSALSAAKRTRAQSEDSSAAPRERGKLGAKTARLDTDSGKSPEDR